MSDSNLEKEFNWYARLQDEKSEKIVEEIKEEVLNTKPLNVEETNNLLDLKLALIDTKKRIIELEEENAKLKGLKPKRTEVVIKNGLYYKTGETTPYCISCYHTDSELIPVITVEFGPTQKNLYHCPVCNEKYPKDNNLPFFTTQK